MKTKTPAQAWYREPYVWMLIAIPLATVIGSVITSTLALQTDDGLVVDDYYKQGLEINRVLERDRLAAELELQAEVQRSPESKSFRLILTGNASFTPPEHLTVSFLHATRSGNDHKLQAHRFDRYIYQGDLPDLIRGRWHVQIETGDWRVLQTLLVE